MFVFYTNSSNSKVELLPESAGSDVGGPVGGAVGGAVGVPLGSTWPCCSESGEEVRGEEEDGADVSTEEELEVGGAVTADDDDPEEDEEVDLETGAAAGLAATSGQFAPTGLSGARDSWLESPVGAAPSGRMAVPGKQEHKNRKHNLI